MVFTLNAAMENEFMQPGKFGCSTGIKKINYLVPLPLQILALLIVEY
jgi:hypothetical protein